MASFFSDRLTRALASDGFTWATNPNLRLLLVGADAEPYDPAEDDHYLAMTGVDAVELVATNYARQDAGGANASTSFIDHETKLLLDDVIFPALGPGDEVIGAWLIVDPDENDATAWPIAWLDFRDLDGNGVTLTGGDFVVHLTTGALGRIGKG